MQKITPCLWFDDDAEQAARFYASIFKRSKIGRITRYGKEGYAIHGRKAGTVMTVTFRLDGQEFMALNGGPVFTFNEGARLLSIASRNGRWTITGTASPLAGKKECAAGSRTNTACRGRSCRGCWR